MRCFKKVISALLAGAMIMTSTVSAFAETEMLEWKTEEELRLAIRGSDEDVVAAPNGKFDFLATQMTTSEDIKSAEITVLRKGGTDGNAAVTLKIVDISAEYGKDYVIKIPVGIIDKTLPKNSDAPPLIESFKDGSSDINEVSEQSMEQLIEESELSELIEAKVTTPQSIQITEEPIEQPVEELELVEIKVTTPQSIQGTQIGGLAKAYQNSVGRKADKSDWRLSTPDESQRAKEANDRYLSEINGITYDLEFADGEYMKKLYFCTIDDDVSESDEQVVLSLQNPTAGILGDLNTAYVNIQDNDEYEKPEFTLQDKTIYVSEEDKVARVTLVRTSGLYQYAKLIAATAGITAEEDVDYEATSKELVFVPGVKSITVEIPLIKNDYDNYGDNGNKTFSVMFGEQDNGFHEELTALVVMENNETGILAPMRASAAESMMSSNIFSAATVMETATERIVTIPRDTFKPSIFWNQNRHGFYYGSEKHGTKTSYPQAVWAEYKADSQATMYADVDLYGVDKISWKWLNDIREPITADNVMGLVRENRLIPSLWLPESKFLKRGTFNYETQEYKLSDDEKFSPSYKGIYFQTKTNSNKDRSWLYIYDVNLHYNKYKIEFGNTVGDKNDSDCYIVPRKYTGTNTYTEGTPMHVGEIKVKGGKNEGFFNDTIIFEPDFNHNIDTNKVYLWGFKVENKKGEYKKEFEGTNLTLDEATLRLLSESNCLLNDKNTIKVKPIYKQRTHFFQVQFEKEGSGISGFNNLDDIMINAYDTISISGYAKAPYYAAGYLATGYNRSDKTPQNQFPYRPFDISKQINPVNPGKIDEYQPSHDRERLTMLYGDPEINIKYRPGLGGDTSHNDRGEVAVDSAGASGKFDTPILIKPSVMDKTYQIIGNPVDNYQVVWRDFTGDMNGDGQLSVAEKSALGDGDVSSAAVYGNTFYYRPVFPSSIIYYTFLPKDTGMEKLSIIGEVYLKGGTVLNKDGFETPIEGAEVAVGTDVVYTDDKGRFVSSSTDYKWEGQYSLKIRYKGFDFISRTEVLSSCKHVINAFDTLVPEDFKIYRTPKGQSERIVQPYEVENGESTYRFTFRTRSTQPTVKAEKATIRIYSKDGKSLRKEYEIISNSNIFELEIAPAKEGILAGDYMTLQLTDNNGVAYFENKVGFNFIQSLDTQMFNFLQSFKTPITPVLDLLGKVELVADIGIAGKVEDYFERSGENELTMSFGFTKEYEDSSEDEKAEDVKELSEDSSDQKEKTDNAVAKGEKDQKNVKRTSLTSSMSFNTAFGISVVMQMNTDLDSDDYGQFYFKQAVLMGSLSGSYGQKYEIMTPIGIPVFIAWEIAGEASAAYLYEQYDNKKFYFSGDQQIDLSKAGTNNTNRDFTSYGKFYIQPSIRLEAGAGFSMLNVTVEGSAVFQLNFTTVGEGKGDVTLTAGVSVRILFYTKRWNLANKTYSLFEYGRMRYSLFSDEDYRYDSIEDLEQLSRDYLSERSSWKDVANKNMLFAASGGIAEETLLEGSYSNIETKMVKYGDNILLVFIDDDGSRISENRTVLKYSIFDGSGWGEPKAVDDDGTLDCQPNLFDLGDRILLTWSDGDNPLPKGTNVIDTLSSLNICGVFFDKASGEFGEVSEITKTTTEDITSDSMPTVAYDEDTGRLILYYTKTEYEPTTQNDDDALLGDVLNGFSLIAYTFYDDIGGWKSTYTDEEKEIIMDNADPIMDEDDFDEYEDNWYGQQFLDLAPQIIVDESDILEYNNDFWVDGETPEVTAEINDKAKVLESTAISYNQLSLFAYVMDDDGDKDTFNDQDIYLQIYDFKYNTFTHPIQLTNDNKKDLNIRFVRNDGETYLYFISGGDIKYTNISSIVKSGLLKVTEDGKDFYILDKSRNSGYEQMVTVVTQKEGNPVSEFEVKTDDVNNIYLVWPEIIITYKDGIQQTSEAATLPENQYRERQIFIARYYYEEKELEGGEIVSVGNWSEPVQYTDEKGANLTELDFVIMDDGNLKAVYNKSYNEEDNTALTTADFILTSSVLIPLEDIIFSSDLPQPGSLDYIMAGVTNDGLEVLKGYKVKIYQCQNEDKILLSENTLDDFYGSGLPGGKVAIVGTSWDVPENLDALYIEVVAENQDGEFVAAAQKSVESKAVLELSNLEADLTDVNTARVNVTATNKGNMTAKDRSVYIYLGDGIIGQGEVDLAVGESHEITMEVNLADRFISTTDKDGNITESIEIKASTGDDSLYTTVERTATAEDIQLMQLISGISFKNSTLSIKKGSEDTFIINREDTYSIGNKTRSFNNIFDIVWKSSDENVARVFNDGSVVAVNNGSSVISAYILPKSNTYYATNMTNPKYITNLETKASVAVKHLEATVTVGANSGGASDKEKIPTSIPENTIKKFFKSKKFITKAYTLGTDENADCLVFVDKDGNIVPYSYYDTSTGLMKAWVDDESAEYEIYNVKVDFKDISGMWYEKAVKYLAARNIIAGVGDNKFEPDKNIKRADFVLLLVRLLGLSGETMQSFDDVDSGSYYANALSIAKQNGIIFGDENGQFDPDREISRQDMFTIAHRALLIIGIKSEAGSSETYTDAEDIAEYARESIDYLSNLNLVNGYNGGIAPLLSSRRSETAQFMYNIFNQIVVNK